MCFTERICPYDSDIEDEYDFNNQDSFDITSTGNGNPEDVLEGSPNSPGVLDSNDKIVLTKTFPESFVLMILRVTTRNVYRITIRLFKSNNVIKTIKV